MVKRLNVGKQETIKPGGPQTGGEFTLRFFQLDLPRC